MASVTFDLNFLGQTNNGSLHPDWAGTGTGTGTGIVTSLAEAPNATEIATMRGTYAFITPVSIDSVESVVSGKLVADTSWSTTSTTVYVNGTPYSGYAPSSHVNIGPITDAGVATYSLVNGLLTVDITLQGGPYKPNSGALFFDNPTITVNYTELPAMHNLGINF